MNKNNKFLYKHSFWELQSNILLFAASIISVILGLLLITLIKIQYYPAYKNLEPVPSIIPAVTNTPVRSQSPIATDSAFLSIKELVATISSNFRNFRTDNPVYSIPYTPDLFNSD